MGRRTIFVFVKSTDPYAIRMAETAMSRLSIEMDEVNHISDDMAKAARRNGYRTHQIPQKPHNPRPGGRIIIILGLFTLIWLTPDTRCRMMERMYRPSKKVTPFDFAEGRVVAGKYQILRQLGSGYEGEVYAIVERATGIRRAAKFSTC